MNVSQWFANGLLLAREYIHSLVIVSDSNSSKDKIKILRLGITCFDLKYLITDSK